MKNFSNYTDYDKKDNLHFESKAVHGALGTEPLTGAVSMPIFQAVTYRHPALGESTRLCVQPSGKPYQTGVRAYHGNP